MSSAEQLFFINPTCSCSSGSLHSPVTAFTFPLFLGGSSDPFGGFADFSSPAASASFPSSQGRADLGIAVLLKAGRRARDAMWHYWNPFPFQGKLCVCVTGPQVLWEEGRCRLAQCMCRHFTCRQTSLSGDMATIWKGFPLKLDWKTKKYAWEPPKVIHFPLVECLCNLTGLQGELAGCPLWSSFAQEYCLWQGALSQGAESSTKWEKHSKEAEQQICLGASFESTRLRLLLFLLCWEGSAGPGVVNTSVVCLVGKDCSGFLQAFAVKPKLFCKHKAAYYANNCCVNTV